MKDNQRRLTSVATRKMNEEFYIGWEAKAAPGIGKTLRRVVIALLLIALVVPVALAISQRMIGASVFEWGNVKTFSGILQATPYPHLLVPRPGGERFHTLQSMKNSSGKTDDAIYSSVNNASFHTLQSMEAAPAAFSSYHLVAPWKFGLQPGIVAAFDGKFVTLKGTLIYRGNQTMIEVVNDSIAPATNQMAASALPKIISLGRQTLTGEIVDSKCFLGVMNPGQLTPHRACAIRCISGGVPPVLLVRQRNGPAIYLLLVSADGKPVNQQVLDLVAEPVEITGEVERQGELLILRADPATYRRVR